jgi:predicted nucleotidyltransferase
MVPMKEIRNVSAEIAREFQPEQIVLFGSHADGRATDDSDVDLLVVMPFQGNGARMAVDILNRIQPDIPVELLVRTPRQLRERLASNDFFLRGIIDKGKVLYAESHR